MDDDQDIMDDKNNRREGEHNRVPWWKGEYFEEEHQGNYQTPKRGGGEGG